MSSGALISFNDPRRFGMMKLVPRAELVQGAAAARARARAARGRVQRGRAGAFLQGQADLDQGSALGSESGIRTGQHLRVRGTAPRSVSPKRRASTIATRSGLPNDRAVRLVEAIKAVLRAAIKSGGSSLRDHRRTDGALGEFQHEFCVYDRAGKPCPRPVAAARSNASCKPEDRHSSAQYARNDHALHAGQSIISFRGKSCPRGHRNRNPPPRRCDPA